MLSVTLVSNAGRQGIRTVKNSNMDCIFCNLSNDRIIQENKLFFVINDAYPVTQNHQLIIPKRCGLVKWVSYLIGIVNDEV